jgi:HTH-type transcriptional regulator/antitoxin HipB
MTSHLALATPSIGPILHPIGCHTGLTPDRVLYGFDIRSDMSKYAPVRISSSKDLGIVLTRARKSRGLSQREVAARLGVTQKWISSIEQGKSRAWIDKVLELSYFLGVQLYAKDANEIPTNHAANVPSIDDILSNES